MSGSSLSRATSISFMLGIVVAGCGHESQEQPAEPAAPEVRTTAAQNVLTNSIGMRLILVLAGEFMMGGRESPDELIKAFGREAVNPSYAPAEHPLHRVRIKPDLAEAYTAGAWPTRRRGTRPGRLRTSHGPRSSDSLHNER